MADLAAATNEAASTAIAVATLNSGLLLSFAWITTAPTLPRCAEERPNSRQARPKIGGVSAPRLEFLLLGPLENRRSHRDPSVGGEVPDVGEHLAPPDKVRVVQDRGDRATRDRGQELRACDTYALPRDPDAANVVDDEAQLLQAAPKEQVVVVQVVVALEDEV